MTEANSHTLIIGKDRDNEVIRFGETGVGTATLRLAVDLLRSGGDNPAIPPGSDPTVSIYLGRLQALQAVKRIVVESAPETVITTFLGQVIAHLSARTSSHPAEAAVTDKVYLFASAETLEILPGAFHHTRPLLLQPFFSTLARSLPNLHTLNVAFDPKAEENSHPQMNFTEYISYGRNQSWRHLQVLDISGISDHQWIPALSGGEVRVTFAPSGTRWPEMGWQSRMTPGQPPIQGPTRRLDRANRIRDVIERTVHVAPARGCIFAGPKAKGELADQVDGEGKERRTEIGKPGPEQVHGTVVMEDIDAGLSETGLLPDETGWLEGKIRKGVEQNYGRYGEAILQEVQRRVTVRECKRIAG